MWNTVNRQRISVEETWRLDAEVYERQLWQFEMPLVTKAMNIGTCLSCAMFRLPSGLRDSVNAQPLFCARLNACLVKLSLPSSD
jgi:hypothetical protein